MFEIRELNKSDEASFLKGFTEWPLNETHNYTFDWQPETKFSDHLERLRKNKLGLDLVEGRVPSNIFYGFYNGDIVGRVSIRHSLNAFLLERGGHIGYSVARKFRQRGFATKMFEFSLAYCKSLKLDQVLVTCDDQNEASIRIIEKFNAKLENKVNVNENLVRRYWVEL